jgi:predicted nucleotidyltransferase component of viral defense system
MTDGPKDIAASVRARLSNHAWEHGRPFQEVLQYYAIERFLHRLAVSGHKDRFILKGGIVFIAWGVPLRRPTRDIDLHGKGANTVDNLEAVVRNICIQKVEPDGMRYDPDTVRGEVIQSQAEYEGIRLRFTGYLGTARAYMQIDIGFSDTVVPPAISVDYPTLLEMPSPRLRAYSYETLIAEKLQAMVFLGSINSRMKDFFDIWLLTEESKINGTKLQGAIQATFRNRNTPIPEDTPLALTETFAEERRQLWVIFMKRVDLTNPPDFVQVVGELRGFIQPVLEAIKSDANFARNWTPGTGWTLN